MKKFLLFLALAIVGKNIGLIAQTMPPLLSGMFTQALDSMHTNLGNKSLSAAVQINNNAVWKDAFGISSLQPMVNVTSAHIYELGSVAKTLTAACVLQLVDSQLVNLDDSIYHYLDTMQHINPNITIRQLLQHKSGLYDVFANNNLQPTLLADQDSVWQAADIIATFIKPPVSFPGFQWSYCNTNYLLLGMLIEAITGNPYYTELDNRFFVPLSLPSLGTSAHNTLTSPVAHVWLDIDGDQITDDAHFFYFPWLSLNSAAGAAGGYYGTAEDVTIWMRMYQRGELHSSAILAESQTTVFAPGMPCTYGLGLMKYDFNGIIGYGHGGDLAYSASSWYFPQYDISITVLNNDADFISWDLLPVVEALLIKYTEYLNALAIIDNLSPVQIVKAFPNPFSESLAITALLSADVRDMRVDIMSTDGKLVQSTHIDALPKGQSTFILENAAVLARGFYTMHVYVDSRVVAIQKLLRK